MRTSRLSVTVFFIATLSSASYADTGSTGTNRDQAPNIGPVSEPDPDCDYTNGQLSRRIFRLAL